MKTRNGKIARLPKKIREELNRRLEDGWTGPKLAEWLNELPSVKKVLREQFNCQPISEHNLSRWRDGGFLDWLRHQEALEQTRWMVEQSDDLEKDEGEGDFCERVARVVTVELALQVQQLADIPHPSERWKRLREISLELWRLRTATSYGQSVDLGWQRWERIVDQEEEEFAEQRRAGARKRIESQEEYLEHLMNLLHRPDLRQWVRTDWPNREAEMLRLRQIYGLPPDSKNTPRHPCQSSAEVLRRSAVYNYPFQQNENNS